MMPSHRFVQLAQLYQVFSRLFFLRNNHRPNVSYVRTLAFAGAVGTADSARMEQSLGHAR